MKLLTQELEEKFKQYPLGSQDGKMGNAELIAKLFNPTGAGTWHITEGSKLENGDYQTEMMPLDEKKIEEIKKIFWEMNEVSFTKEETTEQKNNNSFNLDGA